MRILSYFVGLMLFLSAASCANAFYDPLTVPNNKIGIHILFPGEIHEAARLVNQQNKASWGYVTIPIQATDRNRPKWQEFLDKCKEEKIIPILRIATAPSGSNWEKPNNFDLIDFANFLNDLIWPTGNRYIVIFNEVNRSDEYGGLANPESYADILSNSATIFKSRSADFYILPAGLDNAAINRNGSLSWRTFLSRMYRHDPDIFNKIDGWTSHAYPNPDFSVRPDESGYNKIDSFKYDLEYLRKFTKKQLPVFITETGWSDKYLSENQIAYYYKYAFSKVWSDPRVVAVTPFLLNAQEGPFIEFSFIKKNNQEKSFAKTLSELAEKGFPATPSSAIAISQSAEIASKPQILGSESDSMETLEKFYNKLKIILGIEN